MKYRPYIWLGEDQDAHVLDYQREEERRNTIEYQRASALARFHEHKLAAQLAGLRNDAMMQLGSLRHESNRTLGGQALAQNPDKPATVWDGLVGGFPRF